MTPQSAVVTLQHIITRHQSEPDVVFAAAFAITEVATDAAIAGTIIDPLLGADDYDPSPAAVAEPAQQDTMTNEEQLLASAAAAQTAYWDAKQALEDGLFIEIDEDIELNIQTVECLKERYAT